MHLSKLITAKLSREIVALKNAINALGTPPLCGRYQSSYCVNCVTVIYICLRQLPICKYVWWLKNGNVYKVMYKFCCIIKLNFDASVINLIISLWYDVGTFYNDNSINFVKIFPCLCSVLDLRVDAENHGRSYDNTETSFHRGSYSKTLSRSFISSSATTL